MKNFLAILMSGNIIVQILGQFRTKWQAERFIEDNHIEFNKDVCQYSKFESPLFIKIIKP